MDYMQIYKKVQYIIHCELHFLLYFSKIPFFTG